MSKMHYDEETHPFAYHTIFQKDKTAFAANINKMYEYSEKVDTKYLQSNYNEFRSFITNINNAGDIANLDNLKIEVKIKCLEKGVLGSMITLNNPQGESLSNIEITSNNHSSIEVAISKVKYINEGKQAQLLIKTKLLDSFVQPVILNISGNAGDTSFSNSVALPIVITKFLDYYDVTIEEYTAMWLEFTATTADETQRFDSIMYNPMGDEKSIMTFLKKLGGLLSGMGFKVFSPNDSTNYHEIEACAVLIFAEDKMIPILVQASFVPSFPTEFRFSIRTKNENITLFSNLTLDIYSIVKFFVNPK